MTTIEVIDDVRSLASLEPAWDELLRASAADSPFLTWEWIEPWCRHLLGNGTLLVIAVRAEGRLIGLAPFTVRPPEPSLLRPLSRVTFLGHGAVGSDYMDIIARRGAEAEVVRALAEYLGARPLMLDLFRVSPAATVRGLETGLARQRWRAEAVSQDRCPYLRLEGTTWDDYVRSLGPRHRDNVRRRLRKLRESFEVSFDLVEDDAARGAALDQLIAWHNRRWEARGGSTAFFAPELVAFHHDATRAAARVGRLRLYMLSLDGRPVAAHYGLVHRNRFHLYQVAFDDAFSQWSVGIAALALGIERAFQEGLAEYDLLHGGESYKFLWAPLERPLLQLSFYPPRMRGFVYRASVDTRRAAGRFAQRVRPRDMVGER